VIRFAAMSLLALSTAGCVARDAGYSDVRRLVSERARADVRWRHVDGTATSDQVRRLLGAPLTADTAVKVALLNNPAIQASFEDLGAARAGLMRALRLPNPSADAALLYHGADGDPEVDLSVTLDVTDFFFLPARQGAAQSELDAAVLSVAGGALDLALEVRRAHIRYVAAKQIVELRRTVSQAAKASADAAEKIHEAGNSTDLDLANERALYQESRLALAQAETALTTERERLGALMGVWGSEAKWTTPERLPRPPAREIDLSSSERLALSRSLDLALARQRFSAAAKRANLARVEGLLPEVRAGVAAEKEINESRWGVGPAVGLQLPLFYQGQGEVAAARAEMRRQERLHDVTAIQLRSAARTTAATLTVARERVRFYETVLLPLRERVVAETQLQYNAMNAGVFQLIAAKRDQVEAGRAYVEALRDYWLARVEHEQLLAGRVVPVSTALSFEPPIGQEAGSPARH
jgi:cobalt-zinc-cadmium efflux system outer membrane protein